MTDYFIDNDSGSVDYIYVPDTDTTGDHTSISYGYPWWPYYKPSDICPGCGRCNVCGRKAEQHGPHITWGSGTSGEIDV